MLKVLRIGIVGLCLLSGVGCTVSVNTGSPSPSASAKPAATATPGAMTTPAASASPAAAATPASAGDLAIADFKFHEAKDGPEIYTTTFKTGQDIFFSFEVKGFKISPEGQAWIQQDLQLLDPSDKVLLTKENVFDIHDKVPDGVTSVSGKNTIEVTNGSPAGDYKINIIVRDKVAGTSITSSNKISIEAP